MSMTIEALKTIAKRHQYEGVLEISYDESTANFFIKPEDILSDKSFEVINGVELLKVPGHLRNKKTGMNDISCTVYRTIDDIRAVVCLNDVKDRENIDHVNLYLY